MGASTARQAIAKHLPRGVDAATRDLDGTYLQCVLIDTNVDLASMAAFRAAMLTSVPLFFALSLDAGAVHYPAVETQFR